MVECLLYSCYIIINYRKLYFFQSCLYLIYSFIYCMDSFFYFRFGHNLNCLLHPHQCAELKINNPRESKSQFKVIQWCQHFQLLHKTFVKYFWTPVCRPTLLKCWDFRQEVVFIKQNDLYCEVPTEYLANFLLCSHAMLRIVR